MLELTPSEIRTRQFTALKKGGVDPDEVARFLAEVAGVVADQQRAITDARAKLDRAERALVGYRDSEAKIEESVLVANRAREEAEARATEQAELIIGTARREALQILESTRADAEELVAAAREEHERLRRRAAHLKEVVKRTEDVLQKMADGSIGGGAVQGTDRQQLLHAMLREPDAVLVLDEVPKVEVPVQQRMPRGLGMGEAVDMLLDQLAAVAVPG